MTDRIKDEKIRGLKTEAIEHILANLATPEDKPSSQQHPLGGLVHIEGIGQVAVTRLRRELQTRQVAA